MTRRQAANMERVELSEAKIDAIFSGLNQCTEPGAAVGISVGGRPVYRKGFGLASAELGLALSPSVRLRIGSTSKQFTCLAYLLLCEEGRATVDTPVTEILKEVSVPPQITMRQLMTCTSGLRDTYDIFAQFSEHYHHSSGLAQSLTSADMLEFYLQPVDVNTAPESTWIYNNGGWLLLSIAIERLTGQPLEDVLRERIFAPVGMTDTILERSDTRYIPNRASQHVVTPGGGFERLSWGVDNLLGSGAILSTVDDMLRWLAHMDSPHVGTGETWRLMKEPQRLRNGQSSGYGLGLMIDRYRGIETLHHAGNAFGGNAQMLKVPSAQLDIVILVNRQDVWSTELTKQVLDACLPGLDTPTPKSGSFCGDAVFRSPTSGRVLHLFSRADRPYASLGGPDMPLHSNDSVVWRCEGNHSEPKQSIALLGDPARPHGIEYREFGNSDEMSLQNGVAGADREQLLGAYESRFMGIQATITQRDGRLRLSTRGRFGTAEFLLEEIAAGIWRARAAEATRVAYIGGILSFPEAGVFYFWNALTWAMAFERCS